MKRSSLFFMAKVAEQTNRYTDMTMYIKIICLKGIQLNSEERNMLNIGYQNLVNLYRNGMDRV